MEAKRETNPEHSVSDAWIDDSISSASNTPPNTDIIAIEGEDAYSYVSGCSPWVLDDVVFRFSGLDSSDMDVAVFTDVDDFYSHHTSVTCSFILDPTVDMKRGDRIVIIPINFDVTNWENHVIASRMAIDCETEESPHLIRRVEFPKEILAHASPNFPYQFCYMDADTRKPLGKSHPFIFRETISDEFVEVFEEPSSDRESFVMIKDLRNLLGDRCRQLMNKNAKLEIEKQNFAKIIQQKEQDLAAAQLSQGVAEQHIKDLKQLIEDLTSSRDQTIKDFDEMLSKFNDLKTENLKADEEITNLKSQVEFLNQQVRSKDDLMEELLSSHEIENLQKQIVDLQSTIDDMVPKTAYDELKQEKDTLYDLCSSKHDRLQFLEDTIKKSQREPNLANRTAVSNMNTAAKHLYKGQEYSWLEFCDLVEVLEIQNLVIKEDFYQLELENAKLKEQTVKTQELSEKCCRCQNKGKLNSLTEDIDKANESMKQQILEKESQLKLLEENFANFKKEAQRKYFQLSKEFFSERAKLKSANGDLQMRLRMAKSAYGDLYRDRRIAQTKLDKIFEASLKSQLWFDRTKTFRKNLGFGSKFDPTSSDHCVSEHDFYPDMEAFDLQVGRQHQKANLLESVNDMASLAHSSTLPIVSKSIRGSTMAMSCSQPKTKDKILPENIVRERNLFSDIETLDLRIDFQHQKANLQESTNPAASLAQNFPLQSSLASSPRSTISKPKRKGPILSEGSVKEKNCEALVYHTDRHKSDSSQPIEFD